MRDANVYNFRRALPRMSWSPRNLYNLWRRSVGDLVQETVFTQKSNTLFQQRWKSKALMRAYHGDYINEKIFKRWYVPSALPDVRSHKGGNAAEDSVVLSKWAKKDSAAEREQKRKEEEHVKGLAPVTSLMFTEVERRIDVFIFRACLAHSVYEARRLVVHGDVLLNGKKHQNANTRLAPGDMVSVDPKAIRFLQPGAVPTEKTEAEPESGDAETSAVTTESSDSTASEDPGSAASSELQESTPADSPKVAPKQWHPKSQQRKDNLTPFNLPPYASPFIFVPAYIEPSFSTCSAIYLRHPTARPGYSEIPTPYDADGEVARLTWEWYSRMRPRLRSKSQLARMPENRQYGILPAA